MTTKLQTYSFGWLRHLLLPCYLAAAFLLLLGIQRVAYDSWGVNLIEIAVDRATAAGRYLYGLAGWTLVGFVPMACILSGITLKKLFAASGPADEGICRWINELAVGLGLLGTIWGFIQVASGQAGATTETPTETLQAILVGMGSTFLGISMAIWALLLQAPGKAK